MPVATLTTDFGTKDWFVGVMKGVILRSQPTASIVDLSHDVPPGDVRGGSFVLRSSCRYFPPETVHIAVVDPGVGSPRKGIAVQAHHGVFVGPDNGVLSWAVAPDEVLAIRELSNPALFLQPMSATFHGRDVFAPAAAHLLSGAPWEDLGPGLEEVLRLPWPESQRTQKQIQTEVIHVDHFGNAITCLDSKEIPKGEPRLRVLLASGVSIPLASYYQAVPTGHPLAIVGSCGLMEISVHGGSAADQMCLRPGSRVVLRWD
jgi:S-adenosylmethionine hydrolase